MDMYNLKKISKLLSVFFSLFILLFFITPYSINSLGLPPILEQLAGGEVLMDPGRGTVCFHAERPNLNFHAAGEVENVIITGHCPFDGGCKLIRVFGGGALNYVLTGAPKTPDPETDYLVLDFPLIPKGNVNISNPPLKEGGLDSHKLYFYYGRGEGNIEPTVVSGVGTGAENGSESGLQQGTLEFTSFDTPPSGETQKCTFVAWDPFGRVFDSVSLEPIPNVKVTLIDNITKKPAVMKFESNNDTTFADGLFNILVENEGMYQLSLDPIATHLFTKNPTFNPHYSKIYYDLYSPQYTFQEKQGIPTHHDIPLQPLGSPYRAPKVETMKVEEAMNMGESMLYKGRVSHPFAKVCLFGETSRKEFGCTENSDKFGVYQIFIRNEDIPFDERLIPIGTKVDIARVLITPIPRQPIKTDVIVISPQSLGSEPVFGYIEGYTYNEKGLIIPKAKVDVILKSNNKIVYTTYADNKGFFTIYSKNIPIFEYYLQIIPSGSREAARVTTSQFAKANKAYLTSKKINLMKGTKNNQIIANSSNDNLNTNNKYNNYNNFNEENDPKQISSTKTSIFNYSILPILIVLIILVVVSIGVLLYIKKFH